VKFDLILQAILAAKADLLAIVALGAGMIFSEAPGYAMGAAMATVALWLMSRKKCPSDRVVVMIFTFCVGAWGVPLVANMDSMKWVPRPDPMLGEWEALAGLIGGSIGGSALLAFVIAMNRRTAAVAGLVVDVAAKKFGLPDVNNTTVPETVKMTPEEFAEFIGGLGEREKEMFAGYQRRAAARAKSNRD
jgi:hypothetical protein